MPLPNAVRNTKDYAPLLKSCSSMPTALQKGHFEGELHMLGLIKGVVKSKLTIHIYFNKNILYIL